MIPGTYGSELKAMRESGLSFEECLSRLRSKGASIIESIIAVKDATSCELFRAKEFVHTSKTWHDVAEATEKMWDELMQEIEKEKVNPAVERTRLRVSLTFLR
jgi:hypothetical protein